MEKPQERLAFINEKIPLHDQNKDKSIQIVKQNNKNFVYSTKYVALIKRKEVRKPVLGTFDTFVSLIVVSTCVVAFWRGTWVLLEIYDKYTPALLCLVLGFVFYIFCILLQDTFLETVKKKFPNLGTNIFEMIMRRVYTYIFAVTSIMCWRGGWVYIDEFLRVELKAGTVLKRGSGIMLTVCGATLVFILVLRSLRNCIAPPFVFCTDGKTKTFTIPTRFRTKINEQTSLYILDCLFSVLVIGTLVVFVWRGAWALVDIYLFPEDEVWSAWGSLIVGYSSVAIAFMLQPLMRWLCDRITGVSRLLVADLFLIVSLIGTVNVWRGIWNLLNIYFLPEDLELSCWITHWVSLIILILLGCSNSLLVRGVYIDAEEPAGKCVVFPCHYLRLIFQEQKLKQMQNKENRTELENVKPCENNHVVNVQDTSDQCPQTLEVNHKERDNS